MDVAEEDMELAGGREEEAEDGVRWRQPLKGTAQK